MLFRGKKKQSLSVQLKHEPPANHVTQLTVGLSPAPGLTEFLRKRSAAVDRIVGDQTPNELQLLAGYLTASLPYEPSHGLAGSRKRDGTQEAKAIFLKYYSGYPFYS